MKSPTGNRQFVTPNRRCSGYLREVLEAAFPGIYMAEGRTRYRSTSAVYRGKTLAGRRLDIAVPGVLGSIRSIRSIRPTKSAPATRPLPCGELRNWRNVFRANTHLSMDSGPISPRSCHPRTHADDSPDISRTSTHSTTGSATGRTPKRTGD